MADNSFRVLLDFSELNLKSFKFVWMSISPRDLKTIKDLKIAILKKFSFDQVDVHLFLQDGLLPEDENVVVLRENDVIRLQYASLLNSACDDSSITNSLIPAPVRHGSEEIDSKKEKCSKKRKKKSHVSSPNIVEKHNSPEKRVESNKKKKLHLSFETLTENNATSRNSDIINPVDENVGMKDISCADSSKLTSDNWHNCKKKKKYKCSHSDNQYNSFTTNENEIIFSDEIITILDDESSLKFIESNQTKEQKVGKKEFSKTLDNCKSSEVVPCSLSTSISDKNFTECENTNIPTVDLEINCEKKPTKPDEKNETATSNTECIVTNTSSPMLGNNCKKKKRKRRRKRKPMLTDSPFSESASFNSDSTVTEKSKNLDDSLHISSHHMTYSPSEEITAKEKLAHLFSSDRYGTKTSPNLILSTPAGASQNSSKKVIYNKVYNKDELFPNLISNIAKTFLLSPPRSNSSAVQNKASFSLQSGNLHLGTASKPSPTKTSCETKNTSSQSGCENNFSSLRSSIKSPMQTDHSSGRHHLETDNKPSPSKSMCVTKSTSPVNVYEDKSSTFRSLNSPIKTDYSSESRHLEGASKPSASINIFVTKTSTPIQQADYLSRSCHLETARIKSCMTKNTSQSNVSEHNYSSLRSIKSPLQTDFSSRSRHLETASKPSSSESSCAIIKTSPTTVFENNSSSFRSNKTQIKTGYINFKVGTTSTKVLHSAPLNSFPTAGTHIAYKILELDETYSPVVSDYKEGIVTKVFPETDELDIELIKPEVKFGRIGKFENIYDEDEPPPTEVIKTVHLKWSSLIDPIRQIV